MARPDLRDDASYVNDAARIARRGEVISMIESWLAGFADVTAAVAHREAHDVSCAPVLSVKEPPDVLTLFCTLRGAHGEWSAARQFSDPGHSDQNLGLSCRPARCRALAGRTQWRDPHRAAGHE